MNKIILSIALVLLAIAGAYYFTRSSAPLGNVITQSIVPKVSSAGVANVGPQQVITIFAANSGCTSRIVGTASTSVMLSFSSSLTPTAQKGFWQAASSTVTYDNAVYGCGQITAYSAASSTISVTELAQ